MSFTTLSKTAPNEFASKNARPPVSSAIVDSVSWDAAMLLNWLRVDAPENVDVPRRLPCVASPPGTIAWRPRMSAA